MLSRVVFHNQTSFAPDKVSLNPSRNKGQVKASTCFFLCYTPSPNYSVYYKYISEHLEVTPTKIVHTIKIAWNTAVCVFYSAAGTIWRVVTEFSSPTSKRNLSWTGRMCKTRVHCLVSFLVATMEHKGNRSKNGWEKKIKIKGKQWSNPKWLALQPTDPLYKEMLNIFILLSRILQKSCPHRAPPEQINAWYWLRQAMHKVSARWGLWLSPGL